MPLRDAVTECRSKHRSGIKSPTELVAPTTARMYFCGKPTVSIAMATLGRTKQPAIGWQS
jgi:hypothetical protein